MPVIDYPNTPSNGDELQAPNKFVYRWSGGNRWKNVHRPLVLPDYIWPDMGNPTDPYDTGGAPAEGDPWANPISPVTGGGGDDWILEVINMPVSNGESYQDLPLIMRQAAYGDPIYGDVAMARCTGYIDGGVGTALKIHNVPECQYPYVANRGRAIAGTREVLTNEDPVLSYYNNVVGNKWASYPSPNIIDYDTAFPACNLNLQTVLSEEGYANKESVRFRFTASYSYCGEWTGFTHSCGMLQTNATGTEVAGADKEAYDPGALSYASVVTYTSNWLTVHADTENLVLSIRMGGTKEVGDILVEIDDPWGPPVRTEIPIGFATNSEHTKSLVTFGGGTSILRTIKHGDPGRLTNSSYDQKVYGNTIKDFITGATGSVVPSSVWIRDDDNWLAFVDENNNQMIESRRLYTPGDYSSHSVSIYPFDYQTENSRTPSLGYEIVNFRIDPTGTYLYVMDTVGDIRSYQMSTAWDLSTAALLDTLNMSGWGATCFDITHDGYVIVMLKAGSARQIILDTPWDLSTAYDSGFNRYFALENPVDISVSADTSSILVLDIPTDVTLAYKIYNYSRNV